MHGADSQIFSRTCFCSRCSVWMIPKSSTGLDSTPTKTMVALSHHLPSSAVVWACPSCPGPGRSSPLAMATRHQSPGQYYNHKQVHRT